MKSARMIESFAWQMGTEIDRATRIDYRTKAPDRPANWYVAELGLRDGRTLSRHWWDMADGDWGAGFFQSPACDACDDVVAETADVSFGDAWVEPYASDPRGTNVVVVRAPAVLRLIEAARADGRLALDPVDADFVAGTQAAGFRHRREGLAYRLTWAWRRRGLRPVKRVRARRRRPAAPPPARLPHPPRQSPPGATGSSRSPAASECPGSTSPGRGSRSPATRASPGRAARSAACSTACCRPTDGGVRRG